MRALRGILAVATVALAAGSASSGADKPADYAKDVAFLLDAFGTKAAALLKLKGVDWKAVEKEFDASAKSVSSDADLLKLCGRLVARLRDGHAGIIDTKIPWPDATGGKGWGGPGVFLALSGDKVVVKNVWGPAKDRGLDAGAVLAKIDGKPARAWLDAKVAELRDTQGFSTDQQALYTACHWGLGGPGGSKIEFAPASGAKADVERADRVSMVPEGPAYFPDGVKRIGRQSYGKTPAGFAYIHLRDVPGELPDQLDKALAEIGDAAGIVLDCRANGGGGCDHAAVFGRFVPNGTEWRQYKSAGAKPFTGRMVVIVDAGVRSAGETVAGQFKEDGRAYMIGESATAGMSSQKEEVTVPSGLLKIRFSVASNKGRFNGGRGIEGIGVPPDEVVQYDPADLAKGVDTLIRRADELLKSGFPKGKVAYEPPKRK